MAFGPCIAQSTGLRISILILKSSVDLDYTTEQSSRTAFHFICIYSVLSLTHRFSRYLCTLIEKGLFITFYAYRSLNNKKFQGPIPTSLGGILDLYWLDLGNNLLTGELPVSNGTGPGLDNLTDAKHL